MPDQIRLLYAEDNPLDADLTQAHFAQAAPDFALTVVATGAACLTAAAQSPYDALLLDYRLADMDGLDVLRQIIKAGLLLPVVLVTGSGDEELVVEALRIGAADYVPKAGDYLTTLPGLLRALVQDRRQVKVGRTIAAAPRRVLFVEHEGMDIDLTTTHFAEAAPHLSLVVVTTGREALNRLTSEDHFDLVLTDLRMPDMSGLELLRAARHHGLRLPFIIITGKGDEDTAIATLKLGAYDYIVKRDNYLLHLTYAINHAIIRFQLDVANSHLRADLVALNNTLEQKVIARTAELEQEIAERSQREAELQAIVIMAAALRTAVTRADIAPVIVDQLLQLLHAEGAALELLDAGSGQLVLELGRGIWGGAAQAGRTAATSQSAQIIATGQLYLNNQAQAVPALFLPAVLGPCQAVLGAPLIAQTEVIGVLWVARRALLTEVDVRLLQAINDMAATALHRATLHEQMERQIQHLAALRTIDQAISGSLELRLTLAIVLEQLSTQLRVDAADVLLLNEPGLMLESVAERGFRAAVLPRRGLRVGEGQAGLAAAKRQLVHVPNLLEAANGPLRAEVLTQEGFVTYYGVPLVAKGQVKGVLEVFHRSPLRPIDNAQLFEGLQRSSAELALAYDATIAGWSHALDLRDKETEGHSQRVTDLTVRLARQSGLSDRALVDVRRGALLHDIGKMGVPDSILHKPGPLTDAEWVLMHKHPEHAYRMLAPIAYLRAALDIPYCHHEKWDGSGYPRGLKGEEIPLAARLFAVVDVWDALRSERPYRAAWPEAQVRAHIQSLAGSHFDPQLVSLFFAEVERLESQARADQAE